MSTSGADTPAFIAAAVIILALVILRVFAFRWIAQTRSHSFSFSASLWKLLQVLASLAIPGLGQATQGRLETATWYVLFSGIAWLLFGWFAILIHILSALECARS